MTRGRCYDGGVWHRGPLLLALVVAVARPAGGAEPDAAEIERDAVWLMEVPSGVDARAIVVGKGVWAVLRDARFDRARKKLVVTAVDLEPSYFIP